MSRTNETRHIELYETCKFKCRLDPSVCNNKQRWNKNNYRCECKELIDKDICNEGFIWNPSNSEFDCDKSSDVGEYLEYEKFKWKLVDKLVEQCTENIKKVKLANIILVGKGKNEPKCSSCIRYIMLLLINFTINFGIGRYFVYYKCTNHWYLRKYVTRMSSQNWRFYRNWSQ